jgi:hypothetical protein
MTHFYTLENAVFSYLFIRNFLSPSENAERDCVYLFLFIYFLAELAFIISLLLKIIKIKLFIRLCLLLNMGLIMVCFLLHYDFAGTFFYFINTIVFYFFYTIVLFYHTRKRYIDASADDIKYDKTCVICFEQLDITYLVKFNCHHVFHKNCIENYQEVSHNTSCPVCRC